MMKGWIEAVSALVAMIVIVIAAIWKMRLEDKEDDDEMVWW